MIPSVEMPSWSRLLAPLALVACSSTSEPGTGAATSTGGAGGSSADAAGQDTWTNFGEAFFAKYCVSCHDGSITGDFRSYADVVTHQTDIRCGIATTSLSGCQNAKYPPRQFPIGSGPKPSDDERARVVAWIDAGAKQ
jgi:cytochrome c5